MILAPSRDGRPGDPVQVAADVHQVEIGRRREQVLDLDDVFGDLVRDRQGRATMSVIGKSQRLDLVLGPNYRSVVIWSPKDRDFICIEPMAGITDAPNLAQKGVYKELQTVAPGGTWEESFWIRPGGF